MSAADKPLQLNFCVENLLFTCPIFYLKFRHVQTEAFLWTIKFQSGQVNLKSFLPSLATKVCGFVCRTGMMFIFISIDEIETICKTII